MQVLHRPLTLGGHDLPLLRVAQRLITCEQFSLPRGQTDGEFAVYLIDSLEHLHVASQDDRDETTSRHVVDKGNQK